MYQYNSKKEGYLDMPEAAYGKRKSLTNTLFKEKKMKNGLFVKVSFVTTLVTMLTVSLIGAGPVFAKDNDKFSSRFHNKYHNRCDHSDKSWSFGIISDTQWTKEDDGYNPNTIAAHIIKKIDQEFIEAGVDLVIAVGDTVNTGTTNNIYTRALFAQDLYNAGIAFYPLRGNHEAVSGGNPESAAAMHYAFPQIGTGLNNDTPADITAALIPADDLVNNAPAIATGGPFVVGTSFSEPLWVNHKENSLSYSFQYKNATFMLLDQFDVDGNYYNSTIPEQMYWIDKTLSQRPAKSHAFVFAHKNILGRNHKDNMFGANITNTDPGDGDGVDISLLSEDDKDTLEAKIFAENEFIACMQDNGVPLVISGHDHNHYYSTVTSPDGQSTVDQLITQSDSSKFYTPEAPYSANDEQIEQDLYRVGYYIVTVNGKDVVIDYYADTSQGNTSYYGVNGGTFTFEKISSNSYKMR
jgi:hypothetical protein